ncbi:hypothetical protein [Roseovarius salis]|uniref:hypothetical protein n=1 Tax=Roseovarius salis TaxID=3376063 RepID=UPI0037CC1950
MKVTGRLSIMMLALGWQTNESLAFDNAKWSQACQRALTSIDPCDLTETYIRFSCDRVAEKSVDSRMAREEIETTIRSACESKAAMDGRDEDASSSEPYAAPPGACVITTACAELGGLDDDCFELSALRRFRDRYMAARPDRADLVAEYYKKSPILLRELTLTPRRERILARAYAMYVLPAALLAAAGMDEACFRLYRRGMSYLSHAAAAA